MGTSLWGKTREGALERGASTRSPTTRFAPGSLWVSALARSARVHEPRSRVAATGLASLAAFLVPPANKARTLTALCEDSMPIETLLCALVPLAASHDDPPVELGRVRWRTEHDAAFEDARRSGRPVVLLFQEVPG
jgi:hypothetical protein